MPWLAWMAMKHASSALIGLVSEILPTGFWLSNTQVVLYSPSSKLRSGCRKLCISVLVLPWALGFNWSYDYDLAYSDTSYGFGTSLEEGVFILMHILCAIDHAFLLVNPVLLIDSKGNKSWQCWSALLSQMLHSPSALDVSSADG